MKSIINELWHGNIIPQEDSRTNSNEMKELLNYMARLTRISKRASRTIRRKHSKSSTIASASTWASLKLPYSNMPSN